MTQRIRLREAAGSGGGFWDIDRITHVGNVDGLQIRLSHPSVSRYHALIRRNKGGWVIRDLSSAHGTFLNDHRLDSNYRALEVSDRIRFGSVVVEVESIGPAPALIDDNWDSCDDPAQMIECRVRRTTTKRKWQLLALACHHRLWTRLDDRQRQRIEEEDRVADEGSHGPSSGDALVERAFHIQYGTIRLTLSDVFSDGPPSKVRMIREEVTTYGEEGGYDLLDERAKEAWYSQFEVGGEDLSGPATVNSSRSENRAEAEAESTHDQETSNLDISAEASLDSSIQENTVSQPILHLPSENVTDLIPADDGNTGIEPDFQERWIPGHEGSLADVLRCIFPNPFRPLPAIDPYWLAWDDHVVHRLALAMHDEGAFDRLPILADALMDAGCSDADILGHLQKPGIHARGCWVIDSLLGKK